MKIKLVFKVIALTTALILMTSVLLSGLFLHFVDQQSRESIEKLASSLISNLARRSEFSLAFEDVEKLQTIANGVLLEDDVVYVVLANRQKNLRVEALGKNHKLNIPPAITGGLAELTSLESGQYLDSKNAQQIYHLSLPIYLDRQGNDELNMFNKRPGQRERIGTAQLGISLENMQQQMTLVRHTIIALTLVVMAFNILLSIVVAIYITRPIRDLVTGIETVSQGGFDFEIKVRGQDELGRLAQAFNLMTVQLKDTTVSKDYVNNIFRTMTDTLIVLTPQRMIQTVNAATLKMLGYEAQELLGQPMSLILQDQVGLETFFSGQLSAATAVNNIETHYLAKNQQTIPVLFSGAVMGGSSGEIFGIVCMGQDITELVETEKQLKQAKEASDAANRAKSEFLANMSHELRTPLNAILGYAQVLSKQAGLTVQQSKGLATIQDSGDHLLSLINDILDLSKIEAGKMELNLFDFSLSALLNHICEIFGVKAEQNNLSFNYQWVGEAVNGVHGDEKKLRQVLMNLLGNAVKFTRQGFVSLRVTALENDLVRFQVEDSGCGIETHALQKIFESFRQVGDKNSAEGTGLGLPISKQLTTLMGGELVVSSVLDKGSSFSFELFLPLANISHTKILERRTITGFKGEPIRILIVDNNQVNRDLLGEILRPLGFELSEAVDGRDAIDKNQVFKPDLIFMDIRMPNMNGLQAIQHIREQDPNNPVKIIAISASAYDLNRQNCLQIGSDDFIPKPFDQAQLLFTLGQQLKITWRYAQALDAQPPATDAMQAAGAVEGIMEPPPQAQLDRLLDLAKRGNVDGVLEYLAHDIENQDGEKNDRYPDFVQHLRQLANRYQIREMREFITGFNSHLKGD